MTVNKRANSAIITMSVGLGVNLILFFAKLFMGLSTNSISILSDAINNLGDTFTCAISVFSFVMMKRRSEKLSFGYGRMEYVADFLMSIVVCIVGASFLYTAIERMIVTYLMTFTWQIFGVVAATAVAKVGLGFFYLWRNKGVESGVLRASAMDSFTDAGITVMTLIGYSLNKYAKLRLDAIFGIAISGIMLFNGIRLLVGSIRILLGEKMEEETEEKVKDICKKHRCIDRVEGMNLHKYGVEYEELVVDVVFTKEENYVNIERAVSDISKEIKKEFGYEPKICIARSKDEQEQKSKEEEN